MNKCERAVDLFSGGVICAQAILTVYGEAHGLDVDVAARLGRPLGGGMGRSGRTCGALTAAVLLQRQVPSLREGRGLHPGGAHDRLAR